MDWFAGALLKWHHQHGRHDLPWQQDPSPYRVWVSEIMLQQTQVATVIGYFKRFMARFPDVAALAAADLDQVLHLWTGLGYYARARNLHKTSRIVASQHAGEFPQTQAALEALPGIGRSTAGAIRAIAQGQQATILDGNVKRVLARFHAEPGYPGNARVAKRFWALAERHTPSKATATYTQAIMDLGATICLRRNPLCQACPLAARCAARATGQAHAFPEPKPKAHKPVREARFFVIQDTFGNVLLERRALHGLWGGLWNPPERERHVSTDQLMTELGMSQAYESRQAPRFRHTFTHFHLDIEPVFLTLSTTSAVVAEDADRQWVNPHTLDATNNPIGLSAVAVKLLGTLKAIELQ